MATLRKYFDTDFAHVLTLSQKVKLRHRGTQTDFEIVARVHLDFSANVKYISYYIPPTGEDYELCKSLIHNPDWALAVGEDQQIMAGYVGESRMNSSGLVFSGRVFIYTEAALPELKVTALTREARQVGIALQIRGPEFTTERTIAEKPTEGASQSNHETDTLKNSLATSSPKDVRFVGVIGQLLISALPGNWDAVRFEYKGFDDGWEAAYVMKDETGSMRSETLFPLSEEFIGNLERLRNTQEVAVAVKHITFYRNGTYRIENSVPQIKRLCLDEIKSHIEELRASNLRTASIDCLKKHITPIMAGHKKIVPRNTNVKVYRGVKWAERPADVRHLACPPIAKVGRLHRAGREKYPLFYCCTDRNAVFFELGDLSKGDGVALSEWHMVAPVLVNHVGYHREVFEKLGSNRECPSWGLIGDGSEFDESDVIIDRFLASEFTKRVCSGEEHLYKISIAIAEHHFHDDMFDGLMYPTVAMKGMADNFAFKPKAIGEKLVIKKVEYFSIEECVNGSEYKIRLLDFADSFAEDGQIQWRGRRPHWVLRNKGESLNVVVENGKWVARNQDGEMVELE